MQEKIERLLDKHMLKLGPLIFYNRNLRMNNISLGASKLSLSTFSSEDLWKKTGRLDSSSSEVSPRPKQACFITLRRTSFDTQAIALQIARS